MKLTRNQIVNFLIGGAPNGYPPDTPVDGVAHVPRLKPISVDQVPKHLIPFDDLGRGPSPDITGIHFYRNDLKFAQILCDPGAFTHVIADYKAVLTPDVTLGRQMPEWMRMRNTVLARMCGVIWQTQGMTVIPSLRWTCPEDYVFVADGVPKGSVFGVSTYGSMKSRDARYVFEQGLEALANRLEPKGIFIYGPQSDEYRDQYSSTCEVFTQRHDAWKGSPTSPNEHSQNVESGLF